MKKTTIIVIIAIVIIAAIFLIKGKSTVPSDDTVAPTGTTTNTSSGSNYTPGTNVPTSVNVESPKQPTTATITYGANGFSPASIAVKVGATVTFLNTSGTSMWVASNPHPAHTDLPGFDALKGFASGTSYSYTFTKAGSWGYHDHLHSQYGGIVVVQ